MAEIRHCKIEDLAVRHKCEHDGYEYFRRKFVPFGAATLGLNGGELRGN